MTDEATNLADTVILGTGEAGVEAGTGVEVDAGSDLGIAGGDPALSPAPAIRVGAPERYDLALGGMAMDAGLMAEAEPVLRELGLSNDEAGRFMPLAQSLIDRTADRTLQDLIDAGAQQRREWLDAYRADPEIGGAHARDRASGSPRAGRAGLHRRASVSRRAERKRVWQSSRHDPRLSQDWRAGVRRWICPQHGWAGRQYADREAAVSE